MDIETVNNSKLSKSIISPTFTWCFLMPTIHALSLMSNILCIGVFCSSTFIKKPIAIYFICLLLSDSITLLIGYIEMIDRESHMIDKSSLLCMFNENIIHQLTNFIYTFMGRFCVEWMLYKVLWTRASTIVLAILSVQRSRTFFSLSYRETRVYAFFACVFSIIMALTITFLEWVGVEYKKVNNSSIYVEIYESIMYRNSSEQFYSIYLHQNYNESLVNYPCIMESFATTVFSTFNNQSNCSSNVAAKEFYMLTKSILSNRDSDSTEDAIKLLTSIISDDYNLSNNSLLKQQERITKSPDFIPRLFEKRTCQIAINYAFWLKAFEFFNSVSFSFNRHALAIFFGNALPSFIVVLANLLSIKAIFFSKNVKYLKQAASKNRGKRRFQSDLRAFLVILFESFSIIMISWGVPIFLTMYHCHTLYVVNLSLCTKIKDYLALFLFTDLFNSSTNSLLYSLSGKLFRRKFIFILKAIFTCGRGILWHRNRPQLLRSTKTPQQQLSNNPSTIINNYNRNNKHRLSGSSGSFLYSESVPISLNNNSKEKFDDKFQMKRTTYKQIQKQDNNLCYHSTLNTSKVSFDHPAENDSSSDVEPEIPRKIKDNQSRTHPQSIKLFIINKVRFLSVSNSSSSKTTVLKRPAAILTFDKQKSKSKNSTFEPMTLNQQRATDLSLSSSSIIGSNTHSSQRKCLLIDHHSLSRLASRRSVDNQSTVKQNNFENLTSL
ncbi:unnamed protein product [Rotaria socialis]